MNVEMHTLYWDNSEYLMTSHQKVTRYLELPVTYHHLHEMRHGVWMDNIVETSNADIIGFLDIDCVPLNRNIVDDSIHLVESTNSFVGVAQASNHIFPYVHIFAAPSFYFISKDCWYKLGKPTFAETKRSDVAEEVSYVAEVNGVPYNAYYPTHFEREPLEGVWRLSNYGCYGIGTVFKEAIYHLYQGRNRQNQELFHQRCEEIVKGTFSTNGMFRSTEPYDGRMSQWDSHKHRVLKSLFTVAGHARKLFK